MDTLSSISQQSEEEPLHPTSSDIRNLQSRFEVEAKDGLISLNSLFSILSAFNFVSIQQLRTIMYLLQEWTEAPNMQFRFEQVVLVYEQLMKCSYSTTTRASIGIPNYDKFELFLIQKMFSSFPQNDNKEIPATLLRNSLERTYVKQEERLSSLDLEEVMSNFQKSNFSNVGIASFLMCK